MKGNLKRVVALLLAFVLTFGFSTGVMAASDENTTKYTLQVYLQEYDRANNATSATVWNEDDVLEVKVPSGTTLKEALALIEVKYNDEEDSDFVSFVFETDYPDYLESVTYDGTTRTNYGESKDSSGEGETPFTHGIYEGASWMWYYGDANDLPAKTDDYPSETLAEATITENTVITLSYETLKYSW